MADYSGLNVLIVDDIKAMRMVLRTIMQKIGVTKISEAEDGQQALEMATSGMTFDLIVSDWNMPRMDGLEFLKGVRANPDTKSIPFLMVTTEAEMERLKLAIAAGVSAYIKKPFKPATLLDKLDSIFD